MCCLLRPWPGVSIVGEIQVPNRTFGSQNYHPDHPSRTSVPLDRFLQCAFDKLHSFFFSHPLFPVCIAVAVDIGRSRTTNGIRLLVKGATQWYRVDLSAMSSIVACNDHAGTKVTCQCGFRGSRDLVTSLN